MKPASPLFALLAIAAIAGCKKQDPAPASTQSAPATAAAEKLPPVIPDQQIAAPPSPPSAAEPGTPSASKIGRTWTSTDGRTLDAELIARTEDSVKIRRNVDGREFTLPLSAISQADRDYVKTSSVPLTVVKRFDGERLAELKKNVPRIQPDAPLDPNEAVVVDLFGRYERDVRAITEVGYERHIRMLRDRMQADIKRLEPISMTTVRNPPMLTDRGTWTAGSGAWREVWAARAALAWLRGPMHDYVDQLEKLK